MLQPASLQHSRSNKQCCPVEAPGCRLRKLSLKSINFSCLFLPCPVECMLHSLLSRFSLVCRSDVVCASGNDIKHDYISMVQPEWNGYYDAKVCIRIQNFGPVLTLCG